jgi:hemin uptake protein HemP
LSLAERAGTLQPLDVSNANDYHLYMSNTPRPHTSEAEIPTASDGHRRPRRITSNELLGEQRAIVIEHHGREYRLSMTRNGKLILTA